MRRVMYDPFGMRVQGMQQGQQDEINLQDQTRRARAADFDFEEMAPLRRNAAQREDFFGEAAMPYRVNALDLNQRGVENSLYGQDFGLARDASLMSNNADPLLGVVGQRFPGMDIDPQQALDFSDRDWTLQGLQAMLAAEQARANIDNMPMDLQLRARNAAIQEAYARSRQANARGSGGWQSLFGPSAGQAPGAQPVAPPMMQPPAGQAAPAGMPQQVDPMGMPQQWQPTPGQAPPLIPIGGGNPGSIPPPAQLAPPVAQPQQAAPATPQGQFNLQDAITQYMQQFSQPGQ